MTEKRFPVRGTELTIPWEVAEQAREACIQCGVEQGVETRPYDMQEWFTAGGFSEEELDTWAPGWREVAQ